MMKIAVVAALVLASTTNSFAQKVQEVHPWLTECDSYDCFIGYYCNHDAEAPICELCPDNALEACQKHTNQTTIDSCMQWCVRSQQEESCSNETPCEEGSLYCDFPNHNATGTCQTCPDDVSECLKLESSSEFAMEECFQCDLKCVPLHFSETRVGDNATIIPSNALLGSPSANVSGLLVDCTNLIHADESTCPDASDGAVCLVEDYTRNTYYLDVVNKCQASGGRAVLFYGNFEPKTPNDQPWQGSLSFQDTGIPSVSISYNDGKRLKEEMLSSLAQVAVTSVGQYCQEIQFCSNSLPCVGTSAGRYCDFKWSDDAGFCRTCPVDDDGNPNPLACFFNIDEDFGKVMPQDAVESCAEVCASELVFNDCKLCPENVDGFGFGVDRDSEQCAFCPEGDVKYPQQEFPLFGEGVECWQVQKFFEAVEVDANAPNCRLAQMMNYVCGCTGPGYGGASSETKKVVLAWLPRVMALLSLMVSSIVLLACNSMMSEAMVDSRVHFYM